MFNLVSNAIKFTPDAGCVDVVLSDSVHPTADYVTMKVKDAGIGIPPESLPNLFNVRTSSITRACYESKHGFMSLS